jgi:hypothetical protein
MIEHARFWRKREGLAKAQWGLWAEAPVYATNGKLGESKGFRVAA